MKSKAAPVEVQWKMTIHSAPLYLVASAKGIRGAYWRKARAPVAKSLSGNTPEIRNLRRAARQLEEYAAGKRSSFELPLDIEGGTEFQNRVWSELAKIPYGKTLSYREVARKIGNPKAVRAVGSANGKNPVSIIVPCHRVIAANGTLGGYAGGLLTKSRLLEHEKRPRF